MTNCIQWILNCICTLIHSEESRNLSLKDAKRRTCGVRYWIDMVIHDVFLRFYDFSRWTISIKMQLSSASTLTTFWISYYVKPVPPLSIRHVKTCSSKKNKLIHSQLTYSLNHFSANHVLCSTIQFCLVVPDFYVFAQEQNWNTETQPPTPAVCIYRGTSSLLR